MGDGVGAGVVGAVSVGEGVGVGAGVVGSGVSIGAGVGCGAGAVGSGVESAGAGETVGAGVGVDSSGAAIAGLAMNAPPAAKRATALSAPTRADIGREFPCMKFFPHI